MSSPNKSPGLVRVNFDPPQTLMLISGIGPKLARIIVQLRQESGNLDLDTLEVLIRRPLSERELDQLDFAENPMLAATSQSSGTGEHPSRSRAPEPMFESTPYLNQDQMKAELASQISDLEAEITRWEEFPGIWSDFLPQFAKPLFPKRLLFQPDPVVVTGMPILSDVASSAPAPPQSLGLPQMRAGRADYNVPAQFRETSAEHLGHFRAPRSPPAPIMRPCPTHFTMPSNQPVVSGVPLYNNQPVASGVSLPSNQPVVSGVPLYNNQPVASGVSLPSNQPVVSGVPLFNHQPVASGVSLPSNQPVVRGVPLYNNQPVASGVPLYNNQPVASGFSMPNNPPVVSSVPVQSTLPVVGNLTVASNLPILGNNPAHNNPPVAGNPTLLSSVPVQTSPPVPINPPSQRDRDVLTKLPKSLLFDGCSNWLLFKRKFERYARMQDWSDEECDDCLGWCLTGKAVDFYALLTEGRETLPYAELMQRLQERFGAKELPATAQGRFQVAHQEVGESLDDWSDRVLTLATTAFRDLPYAYATEQAVTKFCHGLLDKEAAKHVSLQIPTSMGDAMNMMKIYSHVLLACAAAPRDSQESERVSRCVHEVRRAPSPDTVIGSAVDKLTQVVDRLLGSVGQLSDSCGSQDDDSRVRQPVQVFRSDEDEGLYGEYAAEGSNEDGAQNRGFNKQRHVRCHEGTGGGCPRGHRDIHAYERGSGPNAYQGSGAGNRRNNGYRSGYQNSNVRPEGSKRGRYGSNWGEYPGMARRDISCLFGDLEHFRCDCRVGAGSVANNESIPMSVTEAAEQQSRPEVGRVNQLGSAAQFCLKVQVGDVMVDAVIDSAAEVSLISDRVYKAMKQPPPKQRDVKLLMTGRDASMQGFVVGPVKLKIGNYWYQQHLYVAPTDVDMLLGFDILMNPGRAIINMAEATIIFDGQVLSLEGGSLQHTDHVHDAVPFALPTASEVVRDPQMVTDESTERDHGGSSYVGTFRVQRVAVQSGVRATPTAGHADPAGVTAEDSREKASSCGVTAADRRKRASGYGVTSEVRWNSACGYRVSTSNIKLPTVQEVVRHIGVCTDESTEGGNGKTGGVGGREDEFTEGIDDAVPLQLPTVCEVVRHIGVCTDMSTVRGNGETGVVGDDEDVLTEGVEYAVPLVLPTVREDVRHIGVCTDMSTVRGNGETGGFDNAVPLALPTEDVRHIGVCTDMSTVRGNGETGGFDNAVPLALPTEDVRHIGVCTDMSTVKGNGETGGVGYAVPLAPPTVREVVRDIGVCTDVSTGGGNGETEDVSDEAAAAKGDNSGKPDPDQQGLSSFESTEESSSYGNSVGIVLTGLPKRPVGIVPQELSSFQSTSEESSSYGNSVGIVLTELPKRPAGIVPQELSSFQRTSEESSSYGNSAGIVPQELSSFQSTSEESSSYGNSVGIVLTELPKRPAGIVPQELSSFQRTSEESSSYGNSAGIVPQELSSFQRTSEESSSYGNSVGIVLTELPKRPAGIVPQELSSFQRTSEESSSYGNSAGIVPQELSSFQRTSEESSSYGNSVGIVLTELPKRPAGIVPQELSSFQRTSEESSSYGNSAGIVPQELSSFQSTSEESSSYGNSVGIVLTELPKRPAGIVPQELSSFRNTSKESSSYGNPVGTVLTGLPKRPVGINPQGPSRFVESSSHGNPVGIVQHGLPNFPTSIAHQGSSRFESSGYGNPAGIAPRPSRDCPVRGVNRSESSSRRFPSGNTQRNQFSHGDPSVNRQSSACGYGVVASVRQKISEDGSRGPFRRGSEGWRPSSSRRWERSQRWKLSKCVSERGGLK
ncbi:uncharacterized protein LOC127850461 isoform X4 [Dreissena polymorpha]|uniref:uncharacterized protein LOC127850461 isoform X4 n=1 Tax=Dreissena polymorpha TaxID=45954 RepID=UPI002264A0F5|nr:uncharacterized protein LOC127850461 isoform X4 [Dreissena polymorpha]